MIVKKTADDKTNEKLPSMQIVKSTNYKVNLGLIVGDRTRAILFLGLCHVLGRRCIGQLYTFR